MNAPDLVVRRMRRAIRAASCCREPSYLVTLTDSGKWLHAPGPDFLFAYLETGWPADVQAAITDAFEAALGLRATIKDAVAATSGVDVSNGLYVLDHESMTKAFHSIDGMALTTVKGYEESGTGSGISISKEFFADVLEALGGDVTPMLRSLTLGMAGVQARCRECSIRDSFGILVGMVLPMPVLNVPVTTFHYVFSPPAVASWFTGVNCKRGEPEAYDYSYTVAAYNYDPV